MAAGFQFNQGTQYLFNRVWSVTLSPPGQAAASEYTQLRTQFDIEKGSLGTSTKSKIVLYGLSAASRQKIVKGWNVRLIAGYKGFSDTIFSGNILPNGIAVKRDGPEIMTTIESGDGESAIVLGTFDKSYPAPAMLSVIISDIVTELVTKEGLSRGVVAGIPNVIFQNGFTAHGAVKDMLDKLCKTNGLQWFVHNGAISVFPVTSSNGTPTIQVNSSTGMIGVPSSDGGFMHFVSLLNPGLVPGVPIQMTSSENPSLNGFYQVLRSHFEGDSWDSKWQVSCECRLVSKPQSPFLGPDVANTGGIA
jgi:hypothetical protein